MKNLFLTVLLAFFSFLSFAQDTKESNIFINFEEYQTDSPSLFIDFELKKRSSGDVFMTGGIENFRVKKIKSKDVKNKLEKEYWGIKVDGKLYINSYPYSKIIGYNEILEKGYYSYFIGEPARTEKEQRDLGIINPDQKQISVCCQTGYVILPHGDIKQLNPDLLIKLCKDNETLVSEIEKSNLSVENALEMFDFLSRYNKTKK